MIQVGFDAAVTMGIEVGPGNGCGSTSDLTSIQSHTKSQNQVSRPSEIEA